MFVGVMLIGALWWQGSDAVRTERPAQITLAQAIDESLVYNPEILLAAQGVAVAESDLRTVSLWPNPELYFLASLQPFAGHAFTPTRSGGPPQFDLLIAWPIDGLVFGKRAGRRAVMQHSVKASDATKDDVVRRQVGLTVATFYAVLEAKSRLTLSEAYARNLETSAAFIDEKVQIGSAAASDADRMQLAVLAAQREVRKDHIIYEAAKAQLRMLLGRPSPAADFDVMGTLVIDDASQTVPTFDAAFAQATAQRPDVRALHHRLAQAQAQVIAAQRDAFPPLTVQGGASYQDQRKAMGMPGAYSWAVGLGMGLPIFDRNQGNIARANALQRDVQHRLDAAHMQLQAEVEQGLREYDIAKSAALHEVPKEVATAEAIRARLRAAYDHHRSVDVFALLDAEQVWLETSRQLVTARVEYWRSLFRLNAILGTPFSHGTFFAKF